MPFLTSTASSFNNLKKEEWTLSRVVPNPQPAADYNQFFGRAIAVSGNLAAIGDSAQQVSYNLSSVGTGNGAVRIFDIRTGELLRTIVPPVSEFGNESTTPFFGNFGETIVIKDELLIVGDYTARSTVFSSTRGGFAIYNIYTGALLSYYIRPDTGQAANPGYGYDLAAHGDLLVVGMNFQPANDDVLLFDISNPSSPTVVASISNPGAADTGPGFGNSVGIEGDYLAIGARYQDVGGVTNRGQVYLYDISTPASPSLQATIVNPESVFTNFSSTILMHRGELLVSNTRYDDVRGTDVGRVIFYDISTPTSPTISYNLENPISGSDAAGDIFGFEIKASGNRLIVGSLGAVGGVGEAHIFDFTSKNVIKKLDNPDIYNDTSSNDLFGYYCDIGTQGAVVGSYLEEPLGAAYFYSFTPTTSNFGITRRIDNPNADGSTNPSDKFANTRAVAIYKNKAIVGAQLEDGTVSGEGKAYIIDVTTGNVLHTLTNPNNDGTSNTFDIFGFSVDIYNDRAIVGAPGEDTGGTSGSGAAYVFNVSTGALVYTLTSPNSSFNGSFGRSVSITAGELYYSSGVPAGQYIHAYAAVGAPNEADGGKAYTYDLDNGSLLTTYNNPESTITGADQFGATVVLDGVSKPGSSLLRLLVGAPNEDIPYNLSGSVYVYNALTGALLHTINNPNADGSTNIGDQFGISADISGMRAIVGAPKEEDSNTDSGKAYIIDLISGNVLHTLSNPNADGAATNSDFFGTDVAISNNTAVVGAPGEDIANPGGGSVYFFDASTGNLLNTVINPNPDGKTTGTDSDYFGESVAIFEDKAIVGAYGEQISGQFESGSVYVLER